MTSHCDKILDSLGVPLSPELSNHLKECPTCRSLIETHGRMTPVGNIRMPAASYRAIREKLRSELKLPTSGAPWWRDACLLVGVNLVMVFWAEHDQKTPFPLIGSVLQHWKLPSHWARMLLVFGLTVAIGIIAIIGPFVALSPRSRHLKATLVGVVASTIFLGVGWRWRPLLQHDYLHDLRVCSGYELLFSLLPVMIALGALTRRAYHPLRSAIAIMSSAMTGVFVMRLHCFIGTPFHMMAFHVLPWLLLSTLMIVIRARVPSRSFAP